MRRVGKIVWVNLLVGSLLIALVELVYSSGAWLFFPTKDIWIFEHIGETVRFHPVKGYDLTRTSSRFARITAGKTEFVGSFVGNAQGMPDRDDFTITRQTSGTHRYAVLGDSYSSAPYLGITWPDRVEDAFNSEDRRLELLNFSTDGGGLANWASNIDGLLAAEGYEIDGLIIAVFGDDLRRRFSIADGRDRKHYAFARVPGWNPAKYPQTRQAANRLLDSHEIRNAYNLNTAEFDAALAGAWQPDTPWEFKLTGAVRHYIPHWWRKYQRYLASPRHNEHPRDASGSGFNTGQLELIASIRRYADSRAIPIHVLYLPDLAEASGKSSQHLREVKAFAELLHARFTDGRAAFSGIEPDNLNPLWFPNDKHWNQAGSDTFAEFMTQQINNWIGQRD